MCQSIPSGFSTSNPPLRIQTTNLSISLLTQTCYLSRPSYFPWFDLPTMLQVQYKSLVFLQPSVSSSPFCPHISPCTLSQCSAVISGQGSHTKTNTNTTHRFTPSHKHNTPVYSSVYFLLDFSDRYPKAADGVKWIVESTVNCLQYSELLTVQRIVDSTANCWQ
jgi:hypothetical protein